MYPGGSFDTHEAVKYFVAAGFTERQAEAVTRKIIEVVGYNAATKQDVDDARQGLSKEIAEVRQDLSKEIAEVRQDLSKEIAEVRQDLSKEIAGIHLKIAETQRDIHALEMRLTLRLGGLIATSMGLLAAMKFFG